MTPLPSVTQVLKEVGLIDGRFYNDFARDRGTAVHLATQLLDEERLDRTTVDPAVAPYLAAYERFVREVPTAWSHIEVPLPEGVSFDEAAHAYAYAGSALYAGTPDRRGLVNDIPSLVDIKTGQPADWHGYQLSAYAELAKTPFVRRYGLYLQNDEQYRLVRYADKQDAVIWNAALTVYHAKTRRSK